MTASVPIFFGVHFGIGVSFMIHDPPEELQITVLVIKIIANDIVMIYLVL